MNDAMNIAASGMQAATASLTASASNTANEFSYGPVPSTDPSQPVPQIPGAVYQAINASQSTLPGGGVKTTLTQTLPSYKLAYDPNSPFANVQGMVATPNVDPAREYVNQLVAAEAYKASLNAFNIADQTQKTLLKASG